MFDVVLSVNGQHVTAQGQFAGTFTAPHSLGSNVTLDTLNAFAKAVEKAARSEKPVESEYLRFAQDLYQAFFQGELLTELTKLPEPRQVRLLIDDLRLRKIPWEALCKPKTHEDFLAKGTTYHVVRGGTSTNSLVPSPVDGALRVLVIGPQSDDGDFERLKATTKTSIQWLTPILGATATWRAIESRLRAENPIPHIVHFLGHGGHQKYANSNEPLPTVPSVQLADMDEKPEWLPVAGKPLEQQRTKCYDETNWSWDRRCTGYRLPTEAEWEYAARAGTTTAYSFGDEARDLCTYGNGADLETKKEKHPAWTVNEACNDGYADLAPVGKYKPNPWGLYDMHGNVYEWVWDKYEPYSDKPLTNDTDKPSDHVTDSDARVLRGGSFDYVPRGLRSADRNGNVPTDADELVGFRCVRVVPAQR